MPRLGHRTGIGPRTTRPAGSSARGGPAERVADAVAARIGAAAFAAGVARDRQEAAGAGAVPAGKSAVDLGGHARVAAEGVAVERSVQPAERRVAKAFGAGLAPFARPAAVVGAGGVGDQVVLAFDERAGGDVVPAAPYAEVGHALGVLGVAVLVGPEVRAFGVHVADLPVLVVQETLEVARGAGGGQLQRRVAVQVEILVAPGAHAAQVETLKRFVAVGGGEDAPVEAECPDRLPGVAVDRERRLHAGRVVGGAAVVGPDAFDAAGVGGGDRLIVAGDAEMHADRSEVVAPLLGCVQARGDRQRAGLVVEADADGVDRLDAFDLGRAAVEARDLGRLPGLLALADVRGRGGRAGERAEQADGGDQKAAAGVHARLTLVRALAASNRLSVQRCVA